MTSLFSPKCAMEAYTNCTNRVAYHTKKKKQDGTYSFNWKSCCEEHRTTKKSAVDQMKMSRGCENIDGRLGVICTTTISSPTQLQIDHIDGNKHNNDPANQQILCGCCHALKTAINKDHLNSYTNRVELSSDMFEIY